MLKMTPLGLQGPPMVRMMRASPLVPLVLMKGWALMQPLHWQHLG